MAPDILHEAKSSLRILIPLLDDIINSEYDPGHLALPMCTQSSLPGCDFCGADIFQSFFECSACLDLDADPPRPYQMCAGCYVEGRKCACGGLGPTQRMPFDTLIAARNKGARLISDGPDFLPLSFE